MAKRDVDQSGEQSEGSENTVYEIRPDDVFSEDDGQEEEAYTCVVRRMVLTTPVNPEIGDSSQGSQLASRGLLQEVAACEPLSKGGRTDLSVRAARAVSPV
ncbi:hypothetical protein KSP39_PZI020998 [Platanthera zijinensis]|uniref:Uncharacterized protein n=1 Tax=Platanthera zijinensis TaxID=2320716 RepID=A0AAP0AXW8_9ASPA